MNTAERPWTRELRSAALLFAVIFGATWVSIDLTRANGGVAAMWIANGLLLGVLLRRPDAHWPALFAVGWLANLAARVIHGDPWVLSVGLPVVNLVETWVAATVIRRRVSDIDDPSRLLELSKVAIAGTVGACVLSATLAASLLAASDFDGVGFAENWVTWFAAHLLGMVIVATLTVVALRGGFQLLGAPGRRRDFLACLLLLGATCAIVFMQERYPLLFLVYLPLLLLTYRHGLPGVVMGMVVVAPVSAVAAILHAGPYHLVSDGDVRESALLAQLFVGAGVLLSLPVALALTHRRRLETRVRESESRYRLLAEHGRDIVARLRPDGSFAYVSPAMREILGWTPEEGSRDIVHPDDRQRLAAARAKLWKDGGHATLSYRAQHKDGHYVWLESVGSRIEDADGRPEIIYTARDISARVAAQQAMARAQERLQSLIDGIPAMVTHVDTQQRYTFANAAVGRILGIDPASMIGRSVRDFRDEAQNARIAPHVEAALRGEPQVFEGGADYNGRRVDFQASYVPEFGANGEVTGFYSLITDITALKQAERALAQLAREDSLTGLPNRRQFEERLEQAVARARRQELPIALMLLDVDHFKTINDTHGHPAGDAVLRSVAERIRNSVYDVDLPVRLGGDEFAVLIEFAAGVREASVVARRILDAMAAAVVLEDGTGIVAGTSIGIAFQREPSDGAALVAMADRALYAAKQAGRNTFRVVRD